MLILTSSEQVKSIMRFLDRVINGDISASGNFDSTVVLYRDIWTVWTDLKRDFPIFIGPWLPCLVDNMSSIDFTVKLTAVLRTRIGIDEFPVITIRFTNTVRVVRNETFQIF